MSLVGQKAVYTSSVKYAAVTAWSASATIAAGAIVRQSATPSLYNERCFVAIVGGTTNSTEPTWNLTRGSKTTDNTVTWMEATGLPAFNGDVGSTPNWAKVKNSSITQGHVIKDAAGTHLFICTTSGIAGNGSEPSWNTSAVGNTTTDNGATWTYIGLASSQTAWGAPHARSRNMTQSGWGDNVTKFYIGSDNNETQSTDQIQWARVGSVTPDGNGDGGPVDVLCVDVAGSLPPVSADLKVTGTLNASGNNLAPHGFFRSCYGLVFNAGNSMYCNDDNGIAEKHYEKCIFSLVGGAGGRQILLTSQGAALRTRLTDCTFKFSNTSQQLWMSSASIIVEGCTVDGSGSIPGTFLNVGGNTQAVFKDCDLSALSGSTLCDLTQSCDVEVTFIDCKFPSSYTLAAFTGGPVGYVSRATALRSSNSALPYQCEIADNCGHLLTNTAVTRTGGASDEGTSISWKIDTTSICYSGIQYFECPTWAERNATTGANVTVTMYGIANTAAMPTNAELYMDVDYQGTSGNTQSTRKSNRVADWLATPAALTADTSAWDANATGRANSHSYSVGDIIAVSSNSGRVFFCTTAGTSASSLPGGYATAVDGGSVTDGTATFRAGYRFKMSVVATSPQPQRGGNIYATVFAAKPSTTFILDPQMTLT